MFQKHLYNPENSRALWPMPQGGFCRSQGVELENSGGPLEPYHHKASEKIPETGMEMDGLVEGRNTYKSGKQVCMGLQVH